MKNKSKVLKIFVTSMLVVLLLSLTMLQAFAVGPLTAVRDYKTESLGTPAKQMTVEWDIICTAMGSYDTAQVSAIMGLTGSDQKPTAPSTVPMLIGMNGAKDAPWIFNVRDGGAYDKIANVEFKLNTTYHIKVTADVTTKKYSVWVNGTQIAKDFNFRTGAAAITDIGNFVYNNQEEPNGCKITISNLTAPGLTAAAPAATTNTTTAPVSNPKTGDFGVIPYALLAVGGGVTGVALLRKKK